MRISQLNEVHLCRVSNQRKFMGTFFQQLINGISLGSIYALIALGYTMVYGVLKLINFAHGDIFMVGAFVGFYLANGIGGRAAQSLMSNPEASAFGRLVSNGMIGGNAGVRPLGCGGSSHHCHQICDAGSGSRSSRRSRQFAFHRRRTHRAKSENSDADSFFD